MNTADKIDGVGADGSEASRKLTLLVDLFHRLNRIIPADQKLVTIPPDLTCNEAISLMRKAGYSQVPVVTGTEVLGVFSFRSFAHGAGTFTMDELGKHKLAPGEMVVEEFMEKFEYARVTEEMTKVFDAMDRDNGILIGTPDNLQGILTPMDFLRYLHRLAQPFVLISEIELALRALIELAVTPEQLADCSKRALKNLQPDENKIPTLLSAMTFDNYRMIIVRGENWPLFEPHLGSTRSMADGKLKRIGELRNDVFHFKRVIVPEDIEALLGYRDWLLSKATQADQRRKNNLVPQTNG